MMGFQLKEWWWYRRHALSRHGVHSPFVYDFIDKGLRRKSGSVNERVRGYFQSLPIVAVERPELAGAILLQIGEDTIVVVKNIHSSPEAAATWRALCTAASVTMSIDLFELGLLFFRKEFKVTQHFVLKRY